jgi:hypothetical protein
MAALLCAAIHTWVVEGWNGVKVFFKDIFTL